MENAVGNMAHKAGDVAGERGTGQTDEGLDCGWKNNWLAGLNCCVGADAKAPSRPKG